MSEKKIHSQNLLKVEAYTHPTSDSKGLCAFYSKRTQKCRVHQVKPETCKAGPITFDINMKTKKIEFYIKKPSVCPFAGILNVNNRLLESHLETAKAEITHLISKLSEKELRAVLKIPEPETFKIAENDLPTEIVKKLGLA